MHKKRLKISYDKDSSVLSVQLGNARSADSDIRGNVVIDYDKKGNIVRVNFYDFNLDKFRNGVGALKKFTRHGASLSSK